MLLLAYAIIEHFIAMISAMKYKTAISMYLPLESSDALFTMPLNPLAKQVTENIPSNNATQLIAMSCLFIVIYYFIARWTMQKSDL
jgi:hypothetical protein